MKFYSYATFASILSITTLSCAKEVLKGQDELDLSGNSDTERELVQPVDEKPTTETETVNSPETETGSENTTEATVPEGNGEGTNNPVDDGNDNKNTLSETFQIKSQSNPLDIVIAFDTSTSMKEEISNFTTHFPDFLQNIKTLDNTKVSLLAKNCTVERPTFCLSLQQSDIDKLEQWVSIGNEKVEVGSTNALAMIASTVCKDSNAANSTICGKTVVDYRAPVPNQGEIRLENHTDSAAIATTLSSSLRAESKKAFIVFSDDRPAEFNSNIFLESMDKEFKRENYFFYGITFLDSTSKESDKCVRGTTGVDSQGYEKISQATQGKHYDICLNNWEDLFKDMRDSLFEKVFETEFTLSKQVQTISSIKLDGVEVAAENYELNENTIKLKAGVNLDSAKELVIEYEEKKVRE